MNLILIGTLFFLLTLNLKAQFPKIIWVYWSSGQQTLPHTQKMCFNIMKQYAKSSSWEMRLITQSNMFDYIPKQQYDEFVKGKQLFVTQQLTADFIRLTLMYQYGGVYFDVASALIQDLKWLQNISKNEDIINKYGDQPDVLLFYLDIYQSNQYFYNSDGSKGMVNPGFQPWFIAARPKSSLLHQWKQTFLELVSEDQEYFRRFRQQNKLYYRNCDDGTLIQFPVLFWSTDLYLYVSEALYYVIQKKQRQLDKQIGLFSSNRKYAVNQFKLWTINAFVGPYSFALKEDPRNHYAHFLNLVTKKYDQLAFDSQGKRTAKYFIKLNGQLYPTIQNYLKNSSNILQYQRYSYYTCSFYNQCNRICDHYLYIMKDSFVEKYLIPEYMKHYTNAKILDKNQLESICSQSQTFLGGTWTLEDKYYYSVVLFFSILLLSLILKYFSFDEKVHQL